MTAEFAIEAPIFMPHPVEENIDSEHYFTGAMGAASAGSLISSDDDGLRCLMFCVIVLKNGMVVTGESVSDEPCSWDHIAAKNIARSNAVKKLWPLSGYELKPRITTYQEFTQ